MAPRSWGCLRPVFSQRGGCQLAPRFRLIWSHAFRQQLLRFANVPLSGRFFLSWALGWPPVENCFFVYYCLIQPINRNSTRQPEPGYQGMCPLGHSHKSWSIKHAYKLLSQKHWGNQRWDRRRMWRQHLLASLVSAENCSQPLNVCLIRILSLSHSWAEKLISIFHR